MILGNLTVAVREAGGETKAVGNYVDKTPKRAAKIINELMETQKGELVIVWKQTIEARGVTKKAPPAPASPIQKAIREAKQKPGNAETAAT